MCGFWYGLFSFSQQQFSGTSFRRFQSHRLIYLGSSMIRIATWEQLLLHTVFRERLIAPLPGVLLIVPAYSLLKITYFHIKIIKMVKTSVLHSRCVHTVACSAGLSFSTVLAPFGWLVGYIIKNVTTKLQEQGLRLFLYTTVYWLWGNKILQLLISASAYHTVYTCFLLQRGQDATDVSFRVKVRCWDARGLPLCFSLLFIGHRTLNFVKPRSPRGHSSCCWHVASTVERFGKQFYSVGWNITATKLKLMENEMLQWGM